MRGLTGFIVFVALACAGSVQAASSAEELIGYWSSETKFPETTGIVTVERADHEARAKFKGEMVVAPLSEGEVRFAFPVCKCTLRGRFDKTGMLIGGFWIRPGDQGQFLTAPIIFSSTSKQKWSSTVASLDLRFALYLRIFKRDDGVLIGAFRNPQRNTRGGGSRLFVEREGDEVRFLENNDGKPGIVHKAKWRGTPERLQLMWPEIGRELELVRRSEHDVAGYFPRPPRTLRYGYQEPKPLTDGWTTARADSVGFDVTALEALVNTIASSDPAERRPRLIHSLLVARKGKLVLDEYFFGHSERDLHDLRSAGKTFSSVLLGAQMERGVTISPESLVADLLAKRKPFAAPSPLKEQITLAHLMTHTSGLACNDTDESSPGSEDRMQSQEAVTDWIGYAIDLPMLHVPGTRYAYCSAGMNLAGGALAAASKRWLPQLFDELVAQPLQIETYLWNLAPDGEGYLGGGARLRPRDLLKIGQVYLNAGVWNGKRIVSAEWEKRSTSPLVQINEQTTGLDTETLKNTYPGGADGLAWHVFDISAGGRTYREFEAAGNGGQILAVVPELDLAVVITGGNYNQGFIWGRWRDEIVGGAIIAALKQN